MAGKLSTTRREHQQRTGMTADHDGVGKAATVGDFVLAELRANPALTYDEVKAKAEVRDLKVFPIVFGRAKRMVALEGGGAPVVAEDTGVAEPVAAEPARVVSSDQGCVPTKRGRGRPMSQEMEFVLDFLESAPNAKAKDVQAAASRNGLAVTGAVVARARMRLGVAKAGAKESDGGAGAPARTRAPQVVERRPAQAAMPGTRAVERGSAATAFDIHSIVDSIRSLEAERDGLRDALAEIAAVLDRLRG